VEPNRPRTRRRSVSCPCHSWSSRRQLGCDFLSLGTQLVLLTRVLDASDHPIRQGVQRNQIGLGRFPIVGVYLACPN